MTQEFSGRAWEYPLRPDLGTLEVYKHPARKSVALSIGHGAETHIVAYFRSEGSAAEFIAFMRAFMGSQPVGSE